jgi:hypothetical protein
MVAGKQEATTVATKTTTMAEPLKHYLRGQQRRALELSELLRVLEKVQGDNVLLAVAHRMANELDEALDVVNVQRSIRDS